MHNSNYLLMLSFSVLSWYFRANMHYFIYEQHNDEEMTYLKRGMPPYTENFVHFCTLDVCLKYNAFLLAVFTAIV